MRFFKALLFVFANLFAVYHLQAVYASNRLHNPRQPKGLKDYYKSYFPIGVAVSPASLTGPESKLIQREFNSITAENVMKMAVIHPKENEYHWQAADDMVQYARNNGLKMRGHTLCWHEQTPNWIFIDQQGATIDKKTLLERLKKHIYEVVGRYKGKIYAWDVVNEAISENEGELFRETDWYKICGEEYISKAFEYAHEADPKALLFYNDFNIEKPGKREKTFKLLKKLIENKVPIHGVGIQGHWSVADKLENNLSEAIIQFASFGLQVQITELDISVYPFQSKENGTAQQAVFTPEMEQQQMAQYKSIFEILRRYKEHVSGITFWNVSDKRSWLDNYPVKGRKNYPLLFDENLQRKKAYQEVINF